MDLSFNTISKISSSILINVKFQEKITKLPERLQELNFSNNYIDNLLEKSFLNRKEYVSVFEKLMGLTKLDLSHNEISILPEITFNNAYRLQVLLKALISTNFF